MKKVFLALVLIFMLFLQQSGVIATQTKVLKQIDEIVNNKKVAFSSNPYDYINAKKDIYDEIVRLDNKILPFLISELEKSNDKGYGGLREYIIAAICSDITGIGKDKTESWSNSKEWLMLYNSKNGSLSLEEAKQKINKYISNISNKEDYLY